ncbi:MAG: hydroxymethylglutaryl-CoA lyase [Deltaproteobacteria bacterium]|nr:hydroxymethylglutaryl-CoA lyase [Deltaproteobacteria bacterium]
MYDRLPTTVRLMEVGPRDGLQNEPAVVETRAKLAFIEALVGAGLTRIEITAFVNPRWIPALADQAEVARGARAHPGVRYAALVPNVKGYEAATSSGVHEVAIFLAATDGHNQKNINCSTAEALSRYREVTARAHADGRPFRAYVSCAFGCPYEGKVAPGRVVDLVGKLLALGAYEVSIGDTIGVGNPRQTVELVRALKDVAPLDRLALHLHDTRGTALANIAAALDEGVCSFDSSAGGLGGCPYAPGASGNVATEDLVYMLEGMGVRTGVDLDKLVRASLALEDALGRRLPSKVLAAMRSACA